MNFIFDNSTILCDSLAKVLSDVQYLCLLSNCTKKSANNAEIEYKYLAILYGYLDSWSLISLCVLRLSIRFDFTAL